MGDPGADETTALLRNDHEPTEDLEQRRLSRTNSLSRISSTNLPLYHEEPTPSDDEAASAATIWTIVPVSLLGLSISW